MAHLPKPSKLLMDGFVKLKGRHNDHSLIEKGYDGEYSACALGLIYIGTGVSPEALAKGDIDTTALNKQLFDSWIAVNPVTGDDANPIDTVIVDLNDNQKWSPTQVSNWLRESLGL
jgi:hypothetical protein